MHWGSFTVLIHQFLLLIAYGFCPSPPVVADVDIQSAIPGTADEPPVCQSGFPMGFLSCVSPVISSKPFLWSQPHYWARLSLLITLFGAVQLPFALILYL